MEPNGILIYGELKEDYSIAPVVLELLSKSVELKEKLWGQRIMVCIIGPRKDYENTIKTLGEYGADEVIIVNDNRLSTYNTKYNAEIFTQIAKKYPPRIILIGATHQGKEIAPYTSIKLNTGLTADCTNLNIAENSLLLSTRPTFGGKLTADIICKTFPQMATVHQNTFKAIKKENSANAIFEWIDLDKIDLKSTILNIIKKPEQSKDINNAQIIISGGAAACQKNGFTLIYELAQRLNAAVAGSRLAYEKGYITKSQQIGQTGKTVAPKLYIAVGISGAAQHLAGIKNSGTIIAINNDKDAPIFKNADIGIVGDLFIILRELINELDYEEKDE